MLITDRKNRNYAYISMDDILMSLEETSGVENQELRRLFNSLDYEDDRIKISKESRVYDILKNSKHVINGDTYINPTNLAEAYTRASLEFNYEMRDRLFKYLKKYLDNMAEGKDNEYLVQKILCDDKVMDYVHRYETFEDYTKHVIGTRIDRKVKKQKQKKKQENKNRSFVKIAV